MFMWSMFTFKYRWIFLHLEIFAFLNFIFPNIKLNALTKTYVYRMSMLEDSASYLDGTIYNLEAKVTNFDDNESIIQLMLSQA